VFSPRERGEKERGKQGKKKKGKKGVGAGGGVRERGREKKCVVNWYSIQ
jgi:hypothetical protein